MAIRPSRWTGTARSFFHSQKPGQARGAFIPATQAKGGRASVVSPQHRCARRIRALTWNARAAVRLRVQEASTGQASSHAQMVRLLKKVRPKARPREIDTNRRPEALGLPDQRKSGAGAGREPAVIESGDTQPQRRLTSAGGGAFTRTWPLSLSLLLQPNGRLPCLCTLVEHHLPAPRTSLERLLCRPQFE
jgi:hypothetical protein